MQIETNAHRPPAKRPHRRTPRKFEHALYPLDRLVILAGGSKGHVAAALGWAENTVMGWASPSRQGGFLPESAQEAARLWMEAKGWACPPGFLTEAKIFADPREG